MFLPQFDVWLQQLLTPFALNSNTSFDSDGSQQKFVKTEEPNSYASDGQSDPDDTCAATPRRSPRERNATDLSKGNDQQQVEFGILSHALQLFLSQVVPLTQHDKLVVNVMGVVSVYWSACTCPDISFKQTKYLKHRRSSSSVQHCSQ